MYIVTTEAHLQYGTVVVQDFYLYIQSAAAMRGTVLHIYNSLSRASISIHLTRGLLYL